MFKTSKLALLEYIKNQLLFIDTVTLPGLGSFEIRKIASRIEGKKIIPPKVHVVFNSEKSLDDGILAKSIASAEDLSQEEARQRVLEYIDEILFALNKGEEYIFSGFGKLYRDSENVYRFEKDPAYQVEFESYGLESFELDPIEDLLQEKIVSEKEEKKHNIIPSEEKATRQKGNGKVITSSLKDTSIKDVKNIIEAEKSADLGHEASPLKENNNNRNIFWILAGAVIVILISFVLIRMTTSLLDGSGLIGFGIGKGDKTEIFPEDNNWNLESTLNRELGDAIDSLTLQENALTIEKPIEPQDKIYVEASEFKEFHIIAGSFKDKENAGILQKQLTEKGYPALVIQQGDRLYRVSAQSFKSKNQGLQALSQFKQNTKNNAAWLLGLN